MKLSEVIKAIEDGSENTFRIGERKININCHGDLYATFEGNVTSYLPLNGWKEVKPPRQWSEKELMLFKLLPDWTQWIARDFEGEIYLYESKPRKEDCDFYSCKGHAEELRHFDFLTITFEESPIYIGDLKGE